jgi:hypothetical protein
MQGLFDSGHIVDVILVVMAVEALVLVLGKQRTGYGLSLRDTLSILLPGLGLMLALRAALSGQDWTIVALFLLASLVAHLADLWRRLTLR